MSTQDNLASQENIVANGRHSLCGHRKVDLCVLKEIGMYIQHCVIGVHIGGFCVFGTGFSCVRLCQEFFFSLESYFLNKNMFMSKVCTILFYTM